MKFYFREFFGNQAIQLLMFLSMMGVVLTGMYFQGYWTLLLLVAGALVYAVAEYFAHRFILHRFPKLVPFLYAAHQEHHRNPYDIKHLFSPLYLDVIIYCAYLALLWGIFRHPSHIAPIAAGTLLFQIYYQWMHYAAHRPVLPRTAWGRWMKKKHLFHHFHDEHTWYGVSHPVLDYVMRTNKSKAVRHNKPDG